MPLAVFFTMHSLIPSSSSNLSSSDRRSDDQTSDSIFRSPRNRWLLIAVLLALAATIGWVGVEALSGSDWVVESVEDQIQHASGLDVEIHMVSPGLGDVELHGVRVTDTERAIELWADVVRLDLDVEALRNPRGHDLPAQLDGVRVTLPGGQVLTSRRLSVLRKADGVVESRGQGALEGGDGRVEWDVTAREDLSQFEGFVTLDGLALGSVQTLLPEVLPASVDLREATADGKLMLGLRAPVQDDTSTVTASTSDEIFWDSDLRLKGVTLHGERLAEQPVRDLDLAVVGQGALQLAARRIEVHEASVVLVDVGAEVEVRVVGFFESADGLRLDLGFQLPETRCDDALEAIPAELLGDGAAFDMAGVISGAGRIALDTQRPEDTVFDVKVEDGCEFLRVPESARPDRFDDAFALAVYDEEGSSYLHQTGPDTDA